MNRSVFRRTILVSIWPVADFVLTVLANILIVNTGVIRAVLVMVVVNSIFNVIFLHLLTFEVELSAWVRTQTKKIKLEKFSTISVKIGKAASVIIAYIVSGPAMVGAPLIWLLRIRGWKAYTLAVIGVTLNTILWVGGFYHLFWILVKAAIISRL
ncbi:hypothetical protein HYV21_00560 [Candidatus Microgenomates bacterium]|nr:hypothetical protein [Candidatus Microgenomates bacterium]